jgi:uncharacterized protein YndB with AHSA1/START domain
MSTTTTDLGEATFTRTYDAPQELVFACMTEPEHLTRFWGPVGVSTPIENITVDLRVGGVFETIMVNDADGTEFPSRGVYTEIDPPHALAWIEPDLSMTTRSTFTDLGDGRTRVDIVQTNVPAMFRSPEAQAGMASSFDRFAAHLATLTAGA